MAETASLPVWVTVLSSGLTFAGGLLSGQLSEYLRSKREREARSVARLLAIEDRRNDFQRSTLLDLQEAAVTLVTCYLAAYSFEAEARLGGFAAVYPTTLSQENQQAEARTAMLSSRVRDEQCREMVQKIKDLQTQSSSTTRQTDADKLFFQIPARAEKLIEHIGVLIRGLDDVQN